MDSTKVIFSEDSDNQKDGPFFGSANSGGDDSNTVDSHQHDDDNHEYRDLIGSDNEDHSKTLAKISHSVVPVEGVYVIKKDLEDTFKIDEEIEQEKVTNGQVIDEVDHYYFKFKAMAMDETRDDEQQKQLSDFFNREEERLASKFNQQIKLLKAEIARKESENKLISKNLELLKATVVSQALHLYSCKIKIQASDERMAQLGSKMESLFQDLKTNYEKVMESL